jgi:hypothetical protein
MIYDDDEPLDREPSELERRNAATIKTQERFMGKPFDLSAAATCMHMIRYHAKNMDRSFITIPRFRGVHGARRALTDAGYTSLVDLMDFYFERIPPAFMMVGDVMALPGFDEFEALVIRGSVRKYLGWHEDAAGCTVIDCDMSAALGAWRL